MRKISANLILPVSSAPLRNGIILVNPDGSISDLIDTGGHLREEPGLEFYPGTIIPGLIIPWLMLDEISEFPPQPIPDDRIPADRNPADRNSADSNPADRNPADRIPANSNPADRNTADRNTAEPEVMLAKVDRELIRHGIKGVGLVLSESMVSNGGLKFMSKSSLCYHPVIELCPGRNDDEYEVFNRGIDLLSKAWNEFNLSCSLTACSPAMKYSDIGKFLEEYGRSHINLLSPEGDTSKIPKLPDPKNHQASGYNKFNILNNSLHSNPEMSFDELVSKITLEAAAKIFIEDELGSIEKGKKPGLNLVSGFAEGDSGPDSDLRLKVLV